MVARIHWRQRDGRAEVLAACREIVCVGASAEIFPVDEGQPHAQNPQSRLGSRVPEPVFGSEAARWIGNLSAVDEGADSYGEEAVAVEILVEFGIGEKIADSKRRTALAAITGADMSAHPEIIIPFH